MDISDTQVSDPNGTPRSESVEMTDVQVMLTRGSTVGRYVILNQIGSGGMGIVYAAYDPELDRKVALKLMLPLGADESTSSGRARLVREAQALAKLSHPNVVAIHDVGTLGGQVWIAMEFVAGQTLGTWAKNGKRTWSEILDALMDVARGVAAAHDAGLVHRDLKPDNAMVGLDGRVRVMDFGLAHGRGATHADLTLASTLAADTKARPEFAALHLRLTQVGSLQGTPSYMSPEQWLGKEVTPASDQFGWGVMAWELLLGKLPFEGETVMTLATSVLAGKLSPPSRDSPVPSWLKRVIERALSLNPGGRWPTMMHLIQTIERQRRRQRQLLLSLVVGGAIGALLFGIEAARRWQESVKMAERDSQIAEILAVSLPAALQAQTSDSAMVAARAQALKLFDEREGEKGEEVWIRATDLAATAAQLYLEVENSLETAMEVAPERGDVRALLGDTMLSRALLLDKTGNHDEANAIVARLARFDADGSRVARWHAPSTVVLETTPSDAVIAYAQYRTDAKGRSSLDDQKVLGDVSGQALSLDVGSYLFTFSAPGHENTQLAVATIRGEKNVKFSITLPRTGDIPSGFIYIPPGRFLFGAESTCDELRTAFYEADPLHEVWTDSFLIAKYEVTLGEYIRFLDSLDPEARDRRRPQYEAFGNESLSLSLEDVDGSWLLVTKRQGESFSLSRSTPLVYPGREPKIEIDWARLPVSGVTVDDAISYIDWLSTDGNRRYRLCTEAEWERAARGADDRIYPHGNTLSPDDANWDATYSRDAKVMGPDPVGSHCKSVSPYGVEDMAGNVFEWTTSAREDGDSFVARGGAYFYDAMTLRTMNRARLDPTFRAPTIGFRVCADTRG